MSSTLETVVALKRPIQQWTRGWMLGPPANTKAAQLGLRSGEQIWVVGRAGVIGDGDAEVATAGLAYLAPDFVRSHWETLPAGLTPRRVAAAYSEACTEWGAGELTRFGAERLSRLETLSRRIIHAAPASFGAVFAGWRAMPRPADLGGQVALSMHVLRELRGAASIIAMHAVGLTPLQAVLASPAPPPRSGPEWAEHLGWTGPFEDPAQFVEQRNRAEELNNEILVPTFNALAPAELAEFSELLVSIREAIDM
jgi:hypothetical protein